MRFLIVAAAVAVLGSVSAGTVLHRPVSGILMRTFDVYNTHMTYVIYGQT